MDRALSVAEQLGTLVLTLIVHTNIKSGPPAPLFTCCVHHATGIGSKNPIKVSKLFFFPPGAVKKTPLRWTWLQKTFLFHMPSPILWSAPSREGFGSSNPKKAVSSELIELKENFFEHTLFTCVFFQLDHFKFCNENLLLKGSSLENAGPGSYMCSSKNLIWSKMSQGFLSMLATPNRWHCSRPTNRTYVFVAFS